MKSGFLPVSGYKNIIIPGITRKEKIKFLPKNLEIIYSRNWHGRRFSFLNTEIDLKFIACIIKDTRGFEKPGPFRTYPYK